MEKAEFYPREPLAGVALALESKRSIGADDGNRTGARRFHSYVGVVLVVCLVLATLLALTPRREGSLRQTRLSPIAQTLRELALDGEMPAGENENGPDDAAKHPEAVGAEQPDIS